LKKVVVVTKETEIKFEGNDLKMVDSSSGMTWGGKTLIVNDGKKQLAVFNEWLYWKNLD